MKLKILIPVLACALLLCACGDSAATPEETSPAEPSATADVSVVPNDPPSDSVPSGEERQPRRQNNQTMGRITAIAGSEITVELAKMGGRPDDWQPDPDRQPPEEMPAGEGDPPERPGEPGSPPEGGSGGPGGGRGGFGGGFPMGEPEYTGETATYTVTAEATIQKGGEESDKIALADLADGDVVRLQLDADGQITSITVMELPAENQEAPTE